MKIEAYILNTMPVTLDWQLKSIATQHRYFSNHRIKLNVMDKQHHLIRATQKYCDRWANFPLMRKAYRIYDFLESDADYGIFMDLDKLILHPEKHPAEAMDLNSSYIEVFNFFKNPKHRDQVNRLWKQHDPENGNQLRGWIAEKVNFCNLLMGDAFSWPNVCGGFYAFTREMAEFIVNRWSDMGINPTTSSGIERLTELNHEINRLAVVSGRSDFVDGEEKFFMLPPEDCELCGIHDEHLMCAAFAPEGGERVHYNGLRFSIKDMLMTQATTERDVLTSTWAIVEDHENVKWGSWMTRPLCEEKIAKDPALFLHLIGYQAKHNAHLYEKYKTC